MVVINVYHGRQSREESPNFTFPVIGTISLVDLRKQIHAGLQILPSQFDLTISAHLNTAPPGLPEKYQLFCIDHEQIWEMVLQNATPVLNFNMLELVIQSIPRTDRNNYDPFPGSIPGGSNTISRQYSPVCESQRTDIPRTTNNATLVYDENWAWIVVFQALNKRNFTIVKYYAGSYSVVEI